MDVTLPTFYALRDLILSNQELRPLAPFLQYLPALERLDAISFTTNDGTVNAMDRESYPLVGERLADIPPPTFRLRELRLSQSRLTQAQAQWLLGSSAESLKHAQLQELSLGALPVVEVISASVESLHLKGAMDSPQIGDTELALTVPVFTTLKALRVSGRSWPWDILLRNIKSALESMTISWSKQSMENLTQTLVDLQWQPSLRIVIVRHWAETDVYYGVDPSDIRTSRAELEAVCARRGIPVTWITEGRVREEIS